MTKRQSSGTGNSQGAEGAVTVLVENRRAFLRFLEQRVGPEAAEDLLQEAFGKAIERIETLRDEESVVAWFYRALRNAVVDHYRRRGASVRALDAIARVQDVAVAPPEIQRAICACVARLAESLRPEYADALRRVEIGGMTVKAYAEEQGITQNNAGVRVHRAREALRKRVMASCGACAEHGCVDCRCARRRRE